MSIISAPLLLVVRVRFPFEATRICCVTSDGLMLGLEFEFTTIIIIYYFIFYNYIDLLVT